MANRAVLAKNPVLDFMRPLTELLFVRLRITSTIFGMQLRQHLLPAALAFDDFVDAHAENFSVMWGT